MQSTSEPLIQNLRTKYFLKSSSPATLASSHKKKEGTVDDAILDDIHFCSMCGYQLDYFVHGSCGKRHAQNGWGLVAFRLSNGRDWPYVHEDGRPPL
jgi:hypothetical protein